MVIPGAAVDINHFTVLVHNESLRDTVIPVGTVIGQLCQVDPVVLSPKIDAESVTPPTQLDPSLFSLAIRRYLSSGRIDSAKSCVSELVCFPCMNGTLVW